MRRRAAIVLASIALLVGIGFAVAASFPDGPGTASCTYEISDATRVSVRELGFVCFTPTPGTPATATATSTPPAPSQTPGACPNEVLGDRSGYVDSGDRDLLNGQCLSVVCQAQILSVDTSGGALGPRLWEVFCTGPSDDDHITVSCSPAPNVLSQQGSGLSRTIRCGAASATQTPAAPTPTSTATGTPVPATPTPTGGGGYTPSPCLSIVGQSNQTYRDLDIGPCPESGIEILNSSNITIIHVRIRDAETSIAADNSSNIVIDGMDSTNPRGPIPVGQHVQFDKVDGGAIRNVVGRRTDSVSQPEDGISLYQTNNVIVELNNVSGGTSGSGCGLIADDDIQQGGVWQNHHNTIRNNVVSNYVNCGIGIAGGTDQLVENNQISGITPGSGHAGIYVADYSPGPCARITVSGNTITMSGGSAFWTDGLCGAILGTDAPEFN